MSSSILPAHQTLVILDGYDQAQFGRDREPPGSTIPRIRLKEMAVSKVHACVFMEDEADVGRSGWSVVDMGSMHGTFVRAHSGVAGSSSGPGTRLSAPRTASMPRMLHHLDEITIGSTIFSVHMHHDCLPCEACTSKGNDVPLFSATDGQKGPGTTKRGGVDDEWDSTTAIDRNPKKALNILKRNLLTRHTQHHPYQSLPATYVDRSARRRARFPGHHSGSPGGRTPSGKSRSSSPGTPSAALPPETVSAPSVPLAPSNVGHQLLLKQGWKPGTSLGLADGGPHSSMFESLVAPLEVTGTKNRAGLGSQISEPVTTVQDWEEEGKRRRWERTSAEELQDKG